MTDKFIRTITQSNKDCVLKLACDYVYALLQANDDLYIEIREKTRNDMQNSKFHVMCGEIANQALWQGEKADLYGWKNLLISGHTIATKMPYKLTLGLEGELVNIREKSSRMGVKRMASLISYTDAWAAENGVMFTQKNYWGY